MGWGRGDIKILTFEEALELGERVFGELISGEESDKEWAWLRHLQVPHGWLSSWNGAHTITGLRPNVWVLKIGPGFSLRFGTAGGATDTVSLLLRLGPTLAVEACRLHGQGRIPSLIVLLLDALDILE